MKIYLPILLLTTLVCLHSRDTDAQKGSVRSAKETSKVPSLLCRLIFIDTTYQKGNTTSEYGCAPIVDGEETFALVSVTPPEELVKKYTREAQSSQMVVEITNSTIKDNEVLLGETAKFLVKKNSQQEARKLVTKLTKSKGKRTIFFVRVSTPDSTHKKTLEKYQKRIFSNLTSFKTQYEACSFGKLKWASAGGADVMLAKNVAAYTKPSDFVDAATSKLQAKYGKAAFNHADHVIFCAPPNKLNYIARAGFNHWQVHFNYGFCNFLSGLMHEIGHNLGLSHSGEGSSKYGDETGLMGMSYASEWGPKKCFNGVKNFQLGWYSDRVLTISDPSKPTKVKLTAFVDYNKAHPKEPVIINIADTYYLQYNRAKGMNEASEEKRNQVTVNEEPGWGGNSYLNAGLSAGKNFTVPNFRGTKKTLVIAACWKGDGYGSNKGDIMIVAIGYGKSWCK